MKKNFSYLLFSDKRKGKNIRYSLQTFKNQRKLPWETVRILTGGPNVSSANNAIIVTESLRSDDLKTGVVLHK
ncbi:MAG: hypothetical protein GY749_06360 [Desulfobacteraceae bacterium]|nr:hypothetical protein [Desulfobacteraceae bacterium]